MPNLRADLQLGEKELQQLETSIVGYRRIARLQLSIDTINGKEVWCTAHQYEAAPGGRVLTEDEILERALEAFAPLGAMGYEPIVSVVALDQGTPDKPLTKHRSARDAIVNGREGLVLRQARPRMLFTMVNGNLELLALEDEAYMSKVAAAVKKADHWFRGSHYRR